MHVFLQKKYEYTHEFKKLIRAHQVLIISYQTPRKIMESDENCEFRGFVEFFFKSGAKFLETPFCVYSSFLPVDLCVWRQHTNINPL